MSMEGFLQCQSAYVLNKGTIGFGLILVYLFDQLSIATLEHYEDFLIDAEGLEQKTSSHFKILYIF